MALLDFWKANDASVPPPITDSHDSTFTLFPTEIQMTIMKTILHTKPFDITTLESLLLSDPSLARLCLLITDHPECPYELFRVPNVSTITLDEYEQSEWFNSPDFPVKIVSLIHTDDASLNGDLTNLCSCLYGRFLSPEIPLLVGYYHEKSIGLQLITRLSQRCGSSNMFQRFLNPEGSKDGRSVCIMEKHDMTGKAFDKPMFMSLIAPKRSTLRSLSSFINSVDYEIEESTHLDVIIGDQHDPLTWEFRQLESLQLRFLQGEMSKNDDQDMRRQTRIMHCSLVSLAKLYVEFDTHLIPDLAITLQKLWKRRNEREFTFVNTNWTPMHPGGIGLDSEDTIMPANTETKWFFNFAEVMTKITYIGIPDKVVEGSRWTRLEEFEWWRLSPTTGVPRTEDYDYFNGRQRHAFPNLKKLKMASTTNENPLKLTFATPELEELTLVSLDDGIWDLDSIFVEGLNLVKSAAFVKQTDSYTPVTLSLRDITSVSASIERLTIVGYALDTSLYQGHFPNLQSFTVDVTPLLESRKHNSSNGSNARLSLPIGTFPSLHSVRLTVLRRDQGRVQDQNQESVIKLEVSELCETVEVSSLLLHLKTLVNGIELDKPSLQVISSGVYGRWTKEKETAGFGVGETFKEPLEPYDFDF